MGGEGGTGTRAKGEGKEVKGRRGEDMRGEREGLPPLEWRSSYAPETLQ